VETPNTEKNHNHTLCTNLYNTHKIFSTLWPPSTPTPFRVRI